MISALCGLIGAAIGAFAGHWWSVRRDKHARRTRFIGFLQRWKTEISAPPVGPTVIGAQVNAAVKIYLEKLGSFHEQVEIARDAFKNGAQFDSLTMRLGSLKPKDWDQKDARKVIMDALERLIESCTH
jgi:hypothetical protein